MEYFNLDPGRKRSIILDCCDLTQRLSNDMRDIRFVILDKLKLDSDLSPEPDQDLPTPVYIDKKPQ